MCDNNLFICSYKENYSRYDKNLKDILDEFLDSGKLNQNLKDKKVENKLNYINICRSLKKKWEINLQCMNQYLKQNHKTKNIELLHKVTINNKLKEIKFKYAKNMDVMCIDNLKNIKLYNGSICKITDINENENKIVINNEYEFDYQNFFNSFEPSFCQTIYKYQGATIIKPYTIHELNIMTKRELYTSLSRGKTINNISFNYTDREFINTNEKIIELNNKVFSDDDIDKKYKEGKIYKITFNNSNNIYIGSTTQELKDRLSEHINLSKQSTECKFINHLKNNIQNVNIELIKKYPCKNQKELEKEENLFIQEFLNNKNYICLNTKWTIYK